MPFFRTASSRTKERPITNATIDPSVIQTEILKLDAIRRQALVTGDVQIVSNLLSPDLVYVHSNALQEDRDTYCGHLASGKYRYISMGAKDQRVRVFGDIALLEGRTVIVPVVAVGPSPKLDCRSILIWRQVCDVWLLEYYQGTLLPAV